MEVTSLKYDAVTSPPPQPPQPLRSVSGLSASAASIPIPETPPPLSSTSSVVSSAGADGAAPSSSAPPRPMPLVVRHTDSAALATLPVPVTAVSGVGSLELFAWALCDVIAKNQSSSAGSLVVQPSLAMGFSPFDGTRAPSYSLSRYVHRIARYAQSSPSCFVLALVYMDRIIASRQTTFCLSELNVHRLLIACLVVASKFWSDHFYDNNFYGRVGGVSARELGVLEATALVWLDFRLFVNGEQFLDDYAAMASRCVRPLIIPTLMERVQMTPAPVYPVPSIARTPYEHFLRLLCVANVDADDRGAQA